MKKPSKDTESMEAEDEGELIGVAEISPEGNADLCQKLMERYAKSSAPQHRHLCASAAAMKAILQEEGLPLTPPAYFAAAISAINDKAESLDSDATAALATFLSILLPLVPSKSLPPSKAIEAAVILVELLQKRPEAASTATVRSVVKSAGVLMMLCDLEDWGAIKLPFETIIAFSIDKRPKVRRCAQMCVEKVFMSFQCSFVIEEASKVVLSLFKSYMPLAIELSAETIRDPSKSEIHLKCENFKVLHTLNLLKLSVPYLSKKVNLQILSDMHKLLTSQFTPLTRHILNFLKASFESSRAEVIIPEAGKIIISLLSFINSGENNPRDTVISASLLLKMVLGELRGNNLNAWIGNLPVVFGAIAGLLVSDADTSSQAAGILKDLINNQMDISFFLDSENQVCNDKFMGTTESGAIKSICVTLENVVSISGGVPNEHILAVISDLFLKLGKISYIYMKGILVKLADLMLANGDVAERDQLPDCIGSAVIAMGPEKILTVIPISLQAESLTCSNIWLVPILKKYVVGASLEYFMENIVPLVESLQKACHKVKKAAHQQNVQTCLCGLWDLLPAFCRYPTDTHKQFEHLAKFFTDLLKKDPFMHENIALALQELVNQNKAIVRSICSASESVTHSATCNVEQLKTEAKSVPHHYSFKVATRNIKVLASFSVDLLHALADVFFDSPPEKRIILKEAIGCLASITKTSKVKRIFTLSLEKFKLKNGVDMSEKLESINCESFDNEHGGNTKKEEQVEAQLSILMEFASSLVEGANEDLVNMIFDYIRPALQDTIGVGQSDAYYTLSRIFKEHTWFISSRLDEMMDLLVGVKSPADTMCQKSRFACLHDLVLYVLQSDLEEKSAKAFLILNEIILALKNSNEEARKAAYDLLLRISSSLKNASSVNSDSPYQQLFSMIMGYLSGAPPQIMSGAVSALSLLIYKDNDICFSIPELVPSVLVLLKSKAKEIIKVVLGFVKVLVSCLEASDLRKILPDIVNGILPWSSVSRNHFKSKVTVIFEIITRKCGAPSVKSLAPDKYRGFIKAVLEQRHGRKRSKEADTPDMPLKTPASSIKRGHKRTHEELSHPGEGTRSRSSRTGPQVNRGKKREFGTASTNEIRNSTGIRRGSRWERRSKRPQSESLRAKLGDTRKQAEKGLNKRSRAGREEKVGRRKEAKRNKPPTDRPASASNWHKRAKVDEKPQRRKD